MAAIVVLESKLFTSIRFYDLIKRKILPNDTILAQINAIWKSWKLIQFVHDLFTLLYLFRYMQDDLHSLNSIWYLFFILNSSSLYFLVWNVISTDLFLNIFIRLQRLFFVENVFNLWERIVVYPPHEVLYIPPSSSSSSATNFFQDMGWLIFFRQLLMKPNDRIQWKEVVEIFKQIRGIMMTRIIQFWFHLIGIAILFPMYISLLSFSNTKYWTLSICLFLKILSWCHLIKKVLNLHHELQFQCNQLWVDYHECAKEFQQFCSFYKNLPMIPIETTNTLLSQALIDTTHNELETALTDTSNDLRFLIFSYFYNPEEEKIFDNWIELPIEKDRIKTFIYSNQQVLVCEMEENDSKRIELKNYIKTKIQMKMKCSLIPD